MTNKELGNILGIAERTVQNKRYGQTEWSLTQYKRLIEVFDKKTADYIVSGGSIEAITPKGVSNRFKTKLGGK